MSTADCQSTTRATFPNNNLNNRHYEEALVAITVDDSFKRSSFPLLLFVLLVFLMVNVFLQLLSAHSTFGFRIGATEYGAEFHRRTRSGKPRKVVRLLYSGKNHYDLLV